MHLIVEFRKYFNGYTHGFSAAIIIKNITVEFFLAALLLFFSSNICYSLTNDLFIKVNQEFNKRSENKTFTKNDIYYFSNALISSRSYKQALNSLKKQRLQKMTRSASYKLGDTTSFYVRNIFDQSEWNSINAKLVFDTSSVSIWLETDAISNIFTQNEVDSLMDIFADFLLRKTGNYSVDSTKGILHIMKSYFGSPPNIDGDDKLDILLLDIQDNFQATGSFVAGFFDPNDLFENETSNKRDLIYIDICPTIKYNGKITPGTAISTISHEYQHLIHMNYEGDEPEYVFINEGLSEYAEIFCGFSPRSADAYFIHSNRSLLIWNYNDPIPDYARAALWTEYLFEQIGPDNIKNLVQSSETGIKDYQKLCKNHYNLSFEEIFTNWGFANAINDTNVDPAYGYKHPLRNFKNRFSQIYHDHIPASNTFSSPNLSFTKVSIQNIREIYFQGIQIPRNIRIHSIISFHSDEPVIYPFINAPFSYQTNYEDNANISMIFQNDQTPDSEDDSSFTDIEYLISGQKSGISKTLKYDDGTADKFCSEASYLLINNSVAAKFTPEGSAWLHGVSVNTIFLSEIDGSGIDQFDDRDVIVRICDDNNGFPGSNLTEPFVHSFKRDIGKLKFETISLDEYYEELKALSEPFYIVLSNDGDDENLFGIGLDSSASVSNTFLYGKTDDNEVSDWHILSSFRIYDNYLNGWNAMLRALIIQKFGYCHEIKIEPVISMDHQNMIFKIEMPFEIDTTVSRISAILPSGVTMQGKIENEYSEIVTKFPLLVDGEYKIFMNFFDINRVMAVDTIYNYTVDVPDGFIANYCFPNPFNDMTKIPMLLMERGVININVFNILGQEVMKIDEFPVYVGNYNTSLNLKDLPSGIYFARMLYRRERDNKEVIRAVKLTLLK
ncbi:MAG: T9SS type A sorting domain-containing protein [bacterium]